MKKLYSYILMSFLLFGAVRSAEAVAISFWGAFKSTAKDLYSLAFQKKIKYINNKPYTEYSGKRQLKDGKVCTGEEFARDLLFKGDKVYVHCPRFAGLRSALIENPLRQLSWMPVYGILASGIVGKKQSVESLSLLGKLYRSSFFASAAHTTGKGFYNLISDACRDKKGSFSLMQGLKRSYNRPFVGLQAVGTGLFTAYTVAKMVQTYTTTQVIENTPTLAQLVGKVLFFGMETLVTARSGIGIVGHLSAGKKNTWGSRVARFIKSTWLSNSDGSAMGINLLLISGYCARKTIRSCAQLCKKLLDIKSVYENHG